LIGTEDNVIISYQLNPYKESEDKQIIVKNIEKDDYEMIDDDQLSDKLETKQILVQDHNQNHYYHVFNFYGHEQAITCLSLSLC
jgi:hypothetical protein